MNKPVRYTLKVLKWTALVLLLLYVAVWLYVTLNRQKLIAQVIEKIGERTHGQVLVKDLSVSFLTTFPFFSLQVSGITIRDTLYAQHKEDFFRAEQMYARLNPLAAITSSPLVSKVTIKNGRLYMLTDTTGYTNKYIFKSDVAAGKKTASVLPDLRLKQFEIVMVNPGHQNFHDLMIDDLNVTLDQDEKTIDIEASVSLLIKSLAFNTNKGSYLEKKTVEGDIELKYDRLKKVLSFKDILLELDGHPFRMTGDFNMDTASKAFDLQVAVNQIPFSKMAGFLPFNTSKKLLLYDLEKPVDVKVSVSGTTKTKSKPEVKLVMNTTDNNLNTPLGKFLHASFKSNFTNSVNDTLDHVDENSSLTLADFSADFESIPIRSEAIKISNLKQPFLEFDLKTAFQLQALNDLIGSSTIQFEKGSSELDLLFKGPLTGMDTINTKLNGHMKIRDGEIHYVPRSVILTGCNGTVRFANNDVYVDKLNTRVGGTQLLMNGIAKNVLSKLDSIPEHMTLQWQISSPEMHLADFKSFLKKPSAAIKKKEKARFVRTAGAIDKLFTETDIALNIESPKINYKKFTATNCNADILLSTNRMALRNIALTHAGGGLRFNGTVYNGGRSNAVAINTEMTKLDIPALFHAFNNFGQDALTTKNLKGILTASIKLNTVITDEAAIIADSTRGQIKFLLEKGELNDFEPVKKIGETALKKQNFSQIRFADLENTLEVTGSKYIINKMEIRSTAITLFIQGTFDTKNGTDMSIQVPVRNLLKNQENTDLTDAGKKGGGISVRLRAKTGDDGKLKVSWDPFRKAIKNRKEASDSTTTGR
ncbi:MAG TPA: AsmA-like C-terminal region-containing protein [Flavitalea sp.]|nr:AsmA-like C-terminal region-containing protein [Flavitalea sp.]